MIFVFIRSSHNSQRSSRGTPLLALNMFFFFPSFRPVFPSSLSTFRVDLSFLFDSLSSFPPSPGFFVSPFGFEVFTTVYSGRLKRIEPLTFSYHKRTLCRLSYNRQFSFPLFFLLFLLFLLLVCLSLPLAWFSPHFLFRPIHRGCNPLFTPLFVISTCLVWFSHMLHFHLFFVLSFSSISHLFFFLLHFSSTDFFPLISLTLLFSRHGNRLPSIKALPLLSFLPLSVPIYIFSHMVSTWSLPIGNRLHNMVLLLESLQVVPYER